jgi:3alpha(or 20beta)-hydroxysteroid dehydrogenase
VTDPRGRLAGKVALITGAASGMGEATARLFKSEGARVVLADLNEARGMSIAAELGDALFVRLDISSRADWEIAVDAAEEHFGRLDILVNNAGYFSVGSIDQVSEYEYDRHVAINQHGVLFGIQAAIAPMRRAGGGSIVNISSTTALRGGPGLIAYRAAKWAIRGISRSAAHDLAADGIRVNAVLPGPIETPMINEGYRSADLEEIAARTLMKRFGTPSEVAHATLFLASDDASFVTGAELAVDGGALA